MCVQRVGRVGGAPATRLNSTTTIHTLDLSTDTPMAMPKRGPKAKGTRNAHTASMLLPAARNAVATAKDSTHLWDAIATKAETTSLYDRCGAKRPGRQLKRSLAVVPRCAVPPSPHFPNISL